MLITMQDSAQSKAQCKARLSANQGTAQSEAQLMLNYANIALLSNAALTLHYSDLLTLLSLANAAAQLGQRCCSAWLTLLLSLANAAAQLG